MWGMSYKHVMSIVEERNVERTGGPLDLVARQVLEGF